MKSTIEINGKENIVFGGAISGNIDSIQGNKNEIVLTEQKLKASYPMYFTISYASKNGQQVETQTKLYYHFCQGLHEERSQEEYKTWVNNNQENYTEDERIMFVPDANPLTE